MDKLKFFIDSHKATQSAVIFLSGSGTNAKNVLELNSKKKNPRWRPTVIVTDNPQKSRAYEIASRFEIPFVGCDIKQFYKERGEGHVSLFTSKGREIREEWTKKLREMLLPYQIDFGLLAGFVPLTNITGDFPCLNVHPGDLTVERDGRRLLVGLHTKPIETAILNGFKELRSSVIVAERYSGKGGEMDSGPILGISAPVRIDFMGHSLEEFNEIVSVRPEKRPIGGYGDILETVACHNQELLKRGGDWVVFPRVIDDFASGKFAIGPTEKAGSVAVPCLYCRQKNVWKAIKTVVYGKKTKKLV